MAMGTNVKKLISEMLFREKEGGLTRTKLDMVRALIHYHGAIWKSELIQELTLRASATEGKLDMKQLNEGLQELEKSGVVRIRKALRATLLSDRGVEDELISIIDLHSAYVALAKDRTITSRGRF